jgi:hypothetical protein
MPSPYWQELESLDVDTEAGLKRALEILLAPVLHQRPAFEDRTPAEKEELRHWVQAWIAARQKPHFPPP